MAAEQALPATIPRPRLLRWHDWSSQNWEYRGELHEHVSTPTAAPHAVVTQLPNLPATWWTEVRAALNAIATISTTRLTIQPGFLAWAMPHYLGISPGDYAGAAWTTAHGDFHLANLCAPQLTILDWEGWGLAPPGYDAAMLHSYSLRNPHSAARIRQELAYLLNTSAGNYAELVVITELLHAAAEGTKPDLTGVLRRRAESLVRQASR